MNEYVKGLVKLMHENADWDRAPQVEKYLKDNFKCLGLMTDKRVALLREYNKLHSYEPKQFRQVAKDLWDQPYREFQYLAIGILDRNTKNMGEEDLPFLIELVRDKSWWDSVDSIAASVIGAIVRELPNRRELLMKWSSDEDMWVNRTAILTQLKYKQDMDTDLLEDIIAMHSHRSEFFIRKAIGWVLREYSKTNPEYVENYVNTHELKKLSRDEAMKHILRQTQTKSEA